MIEPRTPLYQWGQKVSTEADIFNDGSYPDPEPEALLTPFARLPGLEGRKMSKSLDNSIYLSDTPAELTAKINRAFTDPTRIRVLDPGHPEGCVVFAYHRKFSRRNFIWTAATFAASTALLRAQERAALPVRTLGASDRRSTVSIVNWASRRKNI